MIRTREWKLIENLGYEPMLFHLPNDPEEMNNLAPEATRDQSIADILDGMRRRLYSVCCPEAVMARATVEQRLRREELAASGRLERELERRFCFPDGGHFVLNPEAIREQYGVEIG